MKHSEAEETSRERVASGSERLSWDSVLGLWFRRYPLFCAGIAQMGGILGARSLGDAFSYEDVLHLYLPLLVLFFLGTLVAEVAGHFRKVSDFLCPAGCMLTALAWGVVSYGFCFTVHSQEDIRAQMGTQEARVGVVRGELLERPTVYSVKEVLGGEERVREVWRVSLSLREVRWEDGPEGQDEWQKVSGEVRAVCPQVLSEDFRAGSLVEVLGVIRLPSRARSPGGFEYRKYLNTFGIYYELRTQGESDWSWLGYEKGLMSQLRQCADRLRGYSVKMLSRGYDPGDPYIGMYQAMTLGERTALDPQMKEVFTHVGTMHLFAISGYNVGIIALMGAGFFSLLGLRARWRSLASLAAVWFYVLLVGAEPPVSRAALMVSVILLGNLLNRPGILLNSWGVSYFVLLSWNPLQLFQASFQLSFTVVLSLILLLPALERFGKEWGGMDLFKPREYVKFWEPVRAAGIIFILGNVWCSLAGWAGSLPLCIEYFGLVPVAGLFVNMVVCPVAFPLQSISVVSVAVGSFWPWLGECCNGSAWFLLWLIERTCFYAEKLPWAYLKVESWYGWSWIVYYVGIVGLFRGILFRRKNLPWLLVYGVMVCLCAGVEWKRPPQVKVSLFAAGEGSAVVVQNTQSRHEYLIDTGDEYLWQKGIKPFLRENSFKPDSLDAILLTHGDAKHLKGFEPLLKTMKVESLYVNPLESRSPYLRRIKEGLAGTEVQPLSIGRGDVLGNLEVLHPSREEDRDLTRGDQGVVVLRLASFGKRILLISDLDPEGQQRLMDREEDLKCDVLVCGVPEYEYPFRSGFLERCSPQFILVETARKTLPEGHKLLEWGERVWLTGRDGGLQIILSQKGGSLVTQEGIFNF